MKTIDTLVQDINSLVNDWGGWDTAASRFLSDEMFEIMERRTTEERDRTPALRMSSLGTKCPRQLWYKIHQPNVGEPLSPKVKLKFLYGDMLEILLLSLVKASGHEVEGEQDQLEIAGVKGHRDCVIDGVTVDIKSASSYAFKKFKEGLTEDKDDFGYIDQLGSYVYAGHKADPKRVHKNLGAFLVIDKVHGEICLDKHWYKDIDREAEVERIKDIVNRDIAPARGFDAERDGYKNKSKGWISNGNLKLGVNCSYCAFKETCWPGLRTFLYKYGNETKPVFFTKVVKTPKVPEVT